MMKSLRPWSTYSIAIVTEQFFIFQNQFNTKRNLPYYTVKFYGRKKNVFYLYRRQNSEEQFTEKMSQQSMQTLASTLYRRRIIVKERGVECWLFSSALWQAGEGDKEGAGWVVCRMLMGQEYQRKKENLKFLY